MMKYYTNLNTENQKMSGELLKKAANHKSLLEALKEINMLINKAANLRMGNAKAKVVSLCRAAVKKNNLSSLAKIMDSGRE
jgi:Bardet-Biedl syndrome 2 protein